MIADETPWYRDGLAFECTRCGACCTGAPGYVWVDGEQVERLAVYRGESVEQFGLRFLRRVGRRLSLIERADGDCIFWDRAQGCTVYPARPAQCRAWPFWPDNIETPADWECTRGACPGSGRGRIHPVAEIEQAARRTPS